jgi:outer membrane cobalamin receptor
MEARVGRTDGAHATLSWVRLDTDVIDAGFGTDPLFREGQSLIRRPENRVSLIASAPAGTRVRVGGRDVAPGKRADLDFLDDFSGTRVTLPGHVVTDVQASYRLVSRGTRDLSLQLRVENVLDTDYREIVNFPSPGRAFFVGLRAGTGF